MTRGTLYLVSTPIGNLADLSPRAREVLGQVDRVYAEDTRRTRKLMSHFTLATPLASLHAHNERERADEVLGLLADGRELALVTDAGTPSVSDPGAAIVREVAEAGHAVVPIPGPSAVLAALAASGFGADAFAFLGFPPRSGTKRDEWLRRCADLALTVVAFESPHRIGRLLADLAAAGLGDTAACVCRELTKVHEEVRRGTVAGLADYYGDTPVRGEVTLVLAASRPPDAGFVEDEEAVARRAAATARELAADGASTREIASALRSAFGLARNAAYEMALVAGESADDGDRAENGEGTGNEGDVEGNRR